MTEAEARGKIVDLFKSWLGYNEDDGTHQAIIDLYNTQTSLPRGYAVKYTDEWCATTISALAVALGWTDIIPTECSCGYQVAGFQGLGRWVEDDSYVPSAGDVIYYYWSDDGAGDCTGWPNHVGMVVSVTGTTMSILEGNKGEAVAYRSMAVDARYIRGYGCPDYASKATNDESEEEDMTEEKIRAIVRDEWAAIVAEMAEEPADDWAVAELALAVEAGITDGTRPKAYVTRQEAAMMAYRTKEG